MGVFRIFGCVERILSFLGCECCWGLFDSGRRVVCLLKNCHFQVVMLDFGGVSLLIFFRILRVFIAANMLLS